MRDHKWSTVDTIAATLCGIGGTSVIALVIADATVKAADIPLWAWWLAIGMTGLGVVLFVLSLFAHRNSSQQSVVLPVVPGHTMSFTMTPDAAAPVAPAGTPTPAPDALAAQHLVDLTFRLSDLLPPFDQAPVIEGRTIQRCHIYGPAVMVARDSDLEHCGFEGDPSIAWWQVDKRQRPIITGVIELRNCTVLDSNFHGVGLVVETEDLDKLRRGFGLPPEPPED